MPQHNHVRKSKNSLQLANRKAASNKMMLSVAPKFNAAWRRLHIPRFQLVRWSETLWTHPLDVLAEGLAEAGAEDLKLDVRVGAAVLKIHRTRQTCDVALKGGVRGKRRIIKLLPDSEILSAKTEIVCYLNYDNNKD